jgi:hypothetical protein
MLGLCWACTWILGLFGFWSLGTEPTTVKELGNRTHHCLKSLGTEPTTVFMLGIGTHYCLLLSTLGISIHLASGNPSDLFSFVLVCSHSCKALNHCTLCFLSVQVYPRSIRSSYAYPLIFPYSLLLSLIYLCTLHCVIAVSIVKMVVHHGTQS